LFSARPSSSFRFVPAVIPIRRRLLETAPRLTCSPQNTACENGIAMPAGQKGKSGKMERLLEVDEAAAKLRISRSMLNKSRVSGDGPPFIKIGARVLYAESDLEKFIALSRLCSTSARPKGAAA
jgi:hypothetical protein